MSLLFYNVYQAALTKDEDILKYALTLHPQRFYEAYVSNLPKDITAFKQALITIQSDDQNQLLDKPAHLFGVSKDIPEFVFAVDLFDRRKLVLYKHNIDEFIQGVPYITPAAQLVLDGHKDAAEFLIAHGANINFVARAAATMADEAYVEELLKRGAELFYVAMGAAVHGHNDGDSNVEVYINRSDDSLNGKGKPFEKGINGAVLGAAMAGYLPFPVMKGARGQIAINYAGWLQFTFQGDNYFMAMGAAAGGYRDVANSLLGNSRHDISLSVVRGALMSGIINKNPIHQIEYLSYFDFGLLPNLISSFNDKYRDMYNYLYPSDEHFRVGLSPAKRKPDRFISEATQKDIISISKLIHIDNLTFDQAYNRIDLDCGGRLDKQQILIRNNHDCQGLLFLLMILFIKNANLIKSEKSQLATLPVEIWLHILKFAMPIELSDEQLKDLGFVMGYCFLRMQLSNYNSHLNANREAAKSFSDLLRFIRNKEDLTKLVSEEIRILREDTPPIVPENNKTYLDYNKKMVPDQYHKIICFWNKTLTDVEVKLEPIPSVNEIIPGKDSKLCC